MNKCTGGIQLEFGTYLTPEQAWDRVKDLALDNPDYAANSVEWFEERAKINEPCSVCEVNKVWRYGGTDLCFCCMIGETDVSTDCELYLDEGEEHVKNDHH